jgi:hypothetical protein
LSRGEEVLVPCILTDSPPTALREDASEWVVLDPNWRHGVPLSVAKVLASVDSPPVLGRNDPSVRVGHVLNELRDDLLAVHALDTARVAAASYN